MFYVLCFALLYALYCPYFGVIVCFFIHCSSLVCLCKSSCACQLGIDKRKWCWCWRYMLWLHCVRLLRVAVLIKLLNGSSCFWDRVFFQVILQVCVLRTYPGISNNRGIPSSVRQYVFYVLFGFQKREFFKGFFELTPKSRKKSLANVQYSSVLQNEFTYFAQRSP